MKKNIIIITATIVGIMILTFIFVKLINHDHFFRPLEEEKPEVIEDKDIKKVEEDKIKVNDKEVKITLKAVLIPENDDEYNIKYVAYLNDKRIEGLTVYSSESVDEIEIDRVVKTIIGKDEIEYIVLKLIGNNNTGLVHENIFVINDSATLLFKYTHDISSIYYKVVGEENTKYIIGANNCEDFKYIYGGNEFCEKYNNLYSTYKIYDNNIKLLECKNKNSENFDGKMIEKELTVEKNVVTLKDTKIKYTIDDANLSGAGFLCPNYEIVSK